MDSYKFKYYAKNFNHGTFFKPHSGPWVEVCELITCRKEKTISDFSKVLVTKKWADTM